MRFFINHWLSNWSSATLLRGLDDHFGLLILAEVIREEFAFLKFLIDAPQHGVVIGQIVAEVHFLVEFLLVLKNDPHWLPRAESMESWVGHHHETSADVNLL